MRFYAEILAIESRRVAVSANANAISADDVVATANCVLLLLLLLLLLFVVLLIAVNIAHALMNNLMWFENLIQFK